MAEPNDQHRKPLVSVEFQTEIDLATSRPERRMFVKMYFDARDSGLLADIGPLRWQTLCALATYIDEKGMCYPSQARLAKDLGIARENVNRRVKDLLAYRFQGRAVITVNKARLATSNGGRWSNNVYEILPVTGFRIFNDDTEPSKTLTPPANSPYVTKTSHRPVSEKRHTGERHTNQTHRINKTFNVHTPMKKEGTENTDRDASVRREALVLEILDVTGDHHSTGFYRLAAATIPENLIYRTLSETKDARARGRIKKSAGAFFTDSLLRLAANRGIQVDPQRLLRSE